MVFVKGQPSANPGGRPRGSKTMSASVYKMLDDYAKDKNGDVLYDRDKKPLTYRQLITRQLMNKAVSGDMNAIKQVFAYIDGAPQEFIDLTTNGESIKEYGDDILEQMANEIEAKLKAIKT